MNIIKFCLVVPTLIWSCVAFSSSCSMSNKEGFHQVGGVLCLSNVNYIEGVAELKKLNINSFSIVDKGLVFFTAKSPLGSFLMINSLDGMMKLIGDMPNIDLEKNIESIRSVDVYLNTYDVYFLSSAWATSGAVHRIRWSVIVNALKDIPIAIDDIEFITSGNSIYVIQKGKYSGNLIIKKHKYKDGGGSYNPYVMVSPAGDSIKEIGEYKESVNDFLYDSGTNEILR
ncbi:hypothetical protein OW293_014750 [Providencia rettgeri]|nr:hypothetical protein [Providencia rettgeri]